VAIINNHAIEIKRFESLSLDEDFYNWKWFDFRRGNLFFISHIEFYINGDKRRKHIEIYYDNGWKVSKLRENTKQGKKEIAEPERSRIANLFLECDPVRKVLNEAEDMFRLINYINVSEKIEFEKLVVDYSGGASWKDVNLRIKGFDKYNILATIDETEETIEEKLDLEFCFSQGFRDGGKLYGNKVSLVGKINSQKMYNQIVNDKRFKFELFVQQSPQLEPSKPSFEDLYARIGMLEGLCSKLQLELEELKSSRLETEHQ